ncbi:MAG: L-seryl-tRNA(Sec) selenium transferase, partial [Armatimonadota bacterium]
SIPSVNEVLQQDAVAELLEKHPRPIVVDAVRNVLADVRRSMLEGHCAVPPVQEIEQRVRLMVEARTRHSLRRVINATGVVLHTGLGRAVMSKQAAEAVANVLRGHCNLEIDPETGRRGSRDVHTADLLSEITGAESGTVVNNNAASVMLILNTIADGKEVIVSRGELIEIGGSFRMPDVIKKSGAVLREVGTTNKTHLYDYEAAICENTGAILKVHQSNYRMIGFTEQVALAELVELGKQYNLPVIEDLGSGALVDTRAYGLSAEPMVQESVRVGADLVCFSGDKLLGGPQAGIIVGKRHYIQAIKRNPLFRVLRCSKMVYAALEATLRLYLDQNFAAEYVPPIKIIARTPDSIRADCEFVLKSLSLEAKERFNPQITAGESEVGGGSLPGERLPTHLLTLHPKNTSAEELAKKLRFCEPPIYGRVSKEAVLLDFRTVLDGEAPEVAAVLNRLASEL